MLCKGRLLSVVLSASSLVVLMAGCGTLYKVKPVVEAPLPETARVAEAGGLRLRAAPLFTDEESQELFEANLPLAGLLPVRVEMTNTSGAVIELKKAQFLLRDAGGRAWKPRAAKDAVSRILKDNDITLYNPRARAKFEEAVRAYALDLKRPLAPSERRQGLLFFQTPGKEEVRAPRGLILSVQKLSQPVEIRLD
jgi:hypothetical protein